MIRINSKMKILRGFTLIELLVVVGIIGFMASMITYALLGAQTDARVAKTRSTIQKINDVILQQWEEYRYRPVDMRKSSYFGTVPMSSRAQVHFRAMILRDTMRMEMPDRITDLIYEPSCYVVPSHILGAPNFGFLSQRAVPQKYGIMLSALLNSVRGTGLESTLQLSASTQISAGYFSGTGPLQIAGPVVGPASISAWIEKVQSSELLYLIVSTSNYGGTPALELFRASEIGDPDNDGLLEFIDAWGQPIKWLRWPAGFPSDLNRYAEADAMDPQKTDWRFNNPAFPSQSVQPQTIIPLVYSAGPDGVYAIIDDNSAAPVVYATMKQASNSQSYVDPYFVWVGNVANGDSVAANLVPNPVGAADPRANRTNQMGSIHPSFVDASDDNITNHDLILEP